MQVRGIQWPIHVILYIEGILGFTIERYVRGIQCPIQYISILHIHYRNTEFASERYTLFLTL